MVNVRKLAALDLLLLGPHLVLPEFAIGVLLPAGLGTWGLVHSHGRSLWTAYLLLVGLNYLPLLLHSVDITRKTSAQDVLREETTQQLRSYRAGQLWILIPFAILAASIHQELAARRN